MSKQKISNEQFQEMQNKLNKKIKKAPYFAFGFGCLAIISSIAVPFLSGVVATVFMCSFACSTIAMAVSALIGAKAEMEYINNVKNKDIIMGTLLDSNIINYCRERTNELDKNYILTKSVPKEQEAIDNYNDSDENDLSL